MNIIQSVDINKLKKTGCSVLLSLLMVGCGTQAALTENSIIATITTHTPMPTSLPYADMDEKDMLVENINQVLETDSLNSERLTKIEYGFPERGDITITWSIDDKGDQKSTKDSAQNDTVNILKVLEQNETSFIYVILSGTFSMQDELGNTIEIEAMALDFNKSTLDKIHWEDTQSSDIYDMADLSSVHPLFQ